MTNNLDERQLVEVVLLLDHRFDHACEDHVG